ncbi:MAG TPA: DUF2760 domain-containing protein [Bryobacteraceae bacterium]|nr:DUF2760 domain-containing protein [Bryobacteraceae bacterium]
MSRISLAFKSFFNILFKDHLPENVARAYGYVKEAAGRTAPAKAAAPEIRSSDGALQILGILQRDARMLDFLMEDLKPYSDEQVGAAFREVNEQGRATLLRYVTVRPVIDAVDNTRISVPSRDPNLVKLIGNVPADGNVSQGILRHKGWRAERIELPKPPSGQDLQVLAPAEVEVE